MRHELAAMFLVAVVGFPTAAGAVASSELYRTQAYRYGRFDARIRFAAGDGVISSFFLWKEGSEAEGAYWNELDFEKVGANCHMETNAIYGNPEVLHSQTNAMPGDICAGYHDYRFEWTPNYIAWFVDGQEVRRETGATATAFSQNAASGMTFRFNVWPGNANFGGNFSASILPVRQYISWVEYSSYENGAFKFGWREDFNGGSLPSGWATGSWASPYKLSTHSPANVSFVNGIAVLSLTADNATGYSGTPPPDTAAGVGGASTGGAGNVGGASSKGGANSGGAGTGGAPGLGGGVAAGGTKATGGAPPNTGGVNTSSGGQSPNLGGAANSGGARTSQGGATAGGAVNSGGFVANGGSSPANVGGTSTVGGSTSSSNAGGTVGALGGAASTAVSGAAQAPSGTPDDSGGCGCRVAAPGHKGLVGAALGLFGLLLARRRHSRVRSRLRKH